MNIEPNRPLLRMCEVLAWLDIPESVLVKAVRSKLINPVYTAPGARALYRKNEIKEKLLGEPKV